MDETPWDWSIFKLKRLIISQHKLTNWPPGLVDQSFIPEWKKAQNGVSVLIDRLLNGNTGKRIFKYCNINNVTLSNSTVGRLSLSPLSQIFNFRNLKKIWHELNSVMTEVRYFRSELKKSWNLSKITHEVNRYIKLMNTSAS